MKKHADFPAYLLDTEAFRRRIKDAEKKLAELPTEVFGWQAQRQLDARRQGLLTEIRVLKWRIEEIERDEEDI